MVVVRFFGCPKGIFTHLHMEHHSLADNTPYTIPRRPIVYQVNAPRIFHHIVWCCSKEMIWMCGVSAAAAAAQLDSVYSDLPLSPHTVADICTISKKHALKDMLDTSLDTRVCLLFLHWLTN